MHVDADARDRGPNAADAGRRGTGDRGTPGGGLVDRLTRAFRRLVAGGADGDGDADDPDGRDGRDDAPADGDDEDGNDDVDAPPTKRSHRGADDVRWTFVVPGEATRASEQLPEAADVVEGTLRALGDVFRPTSCSVTLSSVDGDGPIGRALPWGSGFRQPTDTGTFDWQVPGDRTRHWLADAARDAPLAGEVRVCLRVDIEGEARVDGWQPGLLSASVNPAPAPEGVPAEVAYRIRLTGSPSVWLAEPGSRRLERGLGRLQGRFAVADVAVDGDRRARALV